MGTIRQSTGAAALERPQRSRLKSGPSKQKLKTPARIGIKPITATRYDQPRKSEPDYDSTGHDAKQAAGDAEHELNESHDVSFGSGCGRCATAEAGSLGDHAAELLR